VRLAYKPELITNIRVHRFGCFIDAMQGFLTSLNSKGADWKPRKVVWIGSRPSFRSFVESTLDRPSDAPPTMIFRRVVSHRRALSEIHFGWFADFDRISSWAFSILGRLL
jgi:hypothetical protein